MTYFSQKYLYFIHFKRIYQEIWYITQSMQYAIQQTELYFATCIYTLRNSFKITPLKAFLFLFDVIYGTIENSLFLIELETGLPVVREKSGKNLIFQGQGKVREFYEKSGKILGWGKVREKSGNFVMNARNNFFMEVDTLLFLI